MFPVPTPVRRQPRARRVFSSSALGAVLATASLASAQQVAAGFQPTQQLLAPGTALVCATAAGDVRFDGTTVTLHPPGQVPQTLLQLPGSAFGSFLLPTDANHVLFGCTGAQHTLWHLPLQGPPPGQPLAQLLYNYDAARLDPAHVLISARTGGFAAPDNELWRLELATGQLQLVASIPGASGPVALAPNGDVFYATGFAGFPVPPGQTRVLRFPRPRVDAALVANRVLGPAHATIVATGLDAAGDMEFDDDGDLVFVDWFNARVAELDDAASGTALSATVLLDYALATVFPTTVQFAAGTTSAEFEAFQPANGTLHVHETDYVAVSAMRSLRTRPAVVTTQPATPVPAGPVALTLSGGAPNGFGLLAFALTTAPGTTLLHLPGFEAPLPWSNALSGTPVLLAIACDGGGAATVAATNPGFTPAVAATLQAAFVSPLGQLGASLPAVVQFGP